MNEAGGAYDDRTDSQAENAGSIPVTPSGEGPGLWVVERSAARVFLFGETVGLWEDHPWLTDETKAALTGSRELWCEANREQLQQSPLLITYALADAPLGEQLNPAEYERVRDTALNLGIDPATLEPLRAWVVGQVLEQAMRKRAGIDPGHGVEAVISGLARDAGLPICTELGSAETTFEWFAGMSRVLECEHLMWTIERIADGSDELDRQVAAWMRGDPSVVEAELARMQRDHPLLYDRFLVERNRNWIPRIQRMLDEPGSVFILVGGAHLAGDDSILRLLATEGLAVQRIQANKAP